MENRLFSIPEDWRPVDTREQEGLLTATGMDNLVVATLSVHNDRGSSGASAAI